jgi:lipopolysaccharide/colanic/teichoic acid biosynthesis glycosyltransferase
VYTERLSAAWFGSLLDRQPGRSSEIAKRAMDLAISSVGLVFTLPLFAVVALAVRFSSPGPILFRQVRVGEGGKTFSIVKFRSMVADAEATGAVWASKSDPRITRVGQVLRQSRLDELPQLWNVLKGEMSIVGPRPERPEFIDALSASLPSWSRRHLLKPGITGWAQVQFAYTDDIAGAATKLSYDLYYLKHRDAALDVLIMFKTFGVMLSKFGSR